jgi:phage baseplate assembly protein gpV
MILTQSGNLTINAPSNVNITAPTVTMSGNLEVAGNITAGGVVTDSGCTLATHTHPIIDTYTGGGSSAPGQG